MTAEDAKDSLLTVLRDYGFSVLVAIGLAWFIRTDLLVPLLEEHRMTVRELRETQHEIAKAISEQTRLLYALQPKVGQQRPQPEEN